MHWPLSTGRPVALFLDFDGTLADLAERPEAVRVQPGLVPLLARLQAQLDGALAIVTGRPIADIDRFLAPLRLPVAGIHGAQGRHADGRGWQLAAPRLDAVEAAARQLLALDPGLQLERKAVALALHYRRAPHLGDHCRQHLQAVVAASPGLDLLEGKCVLEVKPAGVSKGRAIEHFLAEPPFIGRLPAFAGDDVTDEAGFEAVLRRGGLALKVGEGPTCAPHRLASPAALHQALAAWSQGLDQTHQGRNPA